MKKLILLLGVVGVITLMTSCWPGGSSYTVPMGGAVIFIDVSANGTVHGRTSLPDIGAIITSSEMQDLTIGSPSTNIEIGSFYQFAFSWQDENGRIELGGDMIADNVTIDGFVATVLSTELRMYSAPEVGGSSTMLPFIDIRRPIFSPHFFFWRDNWVFSFYYTGGEKPPTVTFYKRGFEDVGTNSTNIDIDIRIESPASSEARNRRRSVAVDMSQLRRDFQKAEENHTLNIIFHFYRERIGGQGPELHTSEPVRWDLARSDGQ